MKNVKTILLPGLLITFACACGADPADISDTPEAYGVFSPRDVAVMLASLPIGEGQLQEVYDAVNSSSSNGYDEEYMMADLLSTPGAGVGDSPQTKASRGGYEQPLKDLIADYFASNSSALTKSAADVEYYLKELSESGMQIYWPYSEDWDGEEMPLVTYDPGYGAQSNFAYEIALSEDGYRVVDSVYVDENVAASRPVWVINSNSDSGFTPMQMIRTRAGVDESDASERDTKSLYMKSFTAKKQFDSWFAGGSEFWIKCGALEGFRASSEKELKQYSPSVTDLMIVVKRRDVGKKLEYNTILISDYSEQMEKAVFLITESDGGTRDSWKCSGEVKIKSKTYGFSVEFPLYSNDDIVWRGQLCYKDVIASSGKETPFGDVSITFSVE